MAHRLKTAAAEAMELHARRRVPLAVKVEVLKRQCASKYVAEIERNGGKLKDIYAKLLLRAKCPISGEQLIIVGCEWDHIIPLALGGTNEPENIQALAPKAHRKKTDKDDEDIARANRRRLYQETGRTSAKKWWKKICNRSFPSKEERARLKAWKEKRDE